MFPPTFPSYFLSWPARDSALPFSALANYWGRTGPIRQKMRRMNADLTRLKCANEIRRTILSGCHSLYYFRSGNGLSFPVGRCVTRYWLAWFFCVMYYFVAILFIFFDLEKAFLFPLGAALRRFCWPGFFAMMFFLFELILGFAYI